MDGAIDMQHGRV